VEKFQALKEWEIQLGLFVNEVLLKLTQLKTPRKKENNSNETPDDFEN